jgi:hypothetical protein
VRGLFVVAGLLSGFGLGLYGLLWLFLPHPDGRIHAQQVMRGVVTGGFVGAVVVLLLDLPGSWGWERPGHPLGGLAFLALIGFGIWWIVMGRHGGHDTWGHGKGGHGPGGWGHGGGWGYTPSAPGTPSGGAGAPTSYPTPGPAPDAPAYGTPGQEAPRPGGPEPESSQHGSGPTSHGYAPGGPGYQGYGHQGYGGYQGPAYQGYRATAVKDATVATPQRVVSAHRPLHSLTLATLGAALVTAGGVLTWDRSVGHIDDAGVVATAVALGVVALGVVTAGLLGRRSGGLAPIAIVLAVVAANGAAWQGTMDGVHEISWTPSGSAVAATGYDLKTGRAVLDLTQPTLTTGAGAPTGASPLTIPVSVGAGELVVIVPTGITTEVDASVGLGGITNQIDGRDTTGGPGLTRTIMSGTKPAVMIVEAEVGVGHIKVVPQGTEVPR